VSLGQLTKYKLGLETIIVSQEVKDTSVTALFVPAGTRIIN
jgi:hypothetical protein